MRKLLVGLFLASVTFIYAADFTERYEKKSVFGKWIDIDNGKIIEINSLTKFSFERLDNDLIILKNGAKKNYLKRIGVSKTKIKGRIVRDIGAKTFASGSDLGVTLTNAKDRSIKVKFRTNKKGFFTDTSLPTGDYILSVMKGRASLKVPVSLNHENESLGTFVLTKKIQAVFKSTLSMDGTYVISNRKRYKAFVNILNYGNKKGRVCYSASLKDKNLKELRFAKSCKMIAAGKSVKVPIYFTFNPIAINSTQKELLIRMTDKKGRAVIEKHPFEVYKNFFNLKIKTPNKAMKGYVVLPGQGVEKVNIKQGKVALPKLSDKEYKLILANTDPRQKTSYIVDIGAEQKLVRGGKKKKRGSARRGKKSHTFKLKQSIARYPNVGDIAVYSFMISDSIVMQEHDKPLRIRFSQKNRSGENVKYRASISNSRLATVSYKNGFLTVSPKPGKNGITTITLQNSRAYGKAKKKRFTLHIREVNDKPRITSKPVKTALEGKVYSYYLKGVDAETKYLNKRAIKLPKWLKFNRKKGLLVGKPKHKHAGKHKVVLRLSDGRYNLTQAFTIKVIALDKAPTAANAFFTMKEDTTLNASLKAKVRKGQDLSFALVKKPAHGTLTLDKSGKFTYNPKTDYFGNDTFKVKALSRGKSTESSVNITVNNVNDAPKASDIISENVGAGPLVVNWLESSSAKDVDGDTLTLSIDEKPTLGTLIINEDNELVYQPYADTHGEEIVNLTIKDGSGLESKITLTLLDVSRRLTPFVLQTGQTVIYHPQDDAIYKKSYPRNYKFDLNETVVKDEVLKNTWYVGAKMSEMTFAEADKYCKELTVGIVENWRLPTIKELVLLTNKGQIAPAADAIFSNIVSDYYWTSTAYGERKNYRWTVYFDYGNDYFAHEKTKHHVQCIRDGIDFQEQSNLTPAMILDALDEDEDEQHENNTSEEIIEDSVLLVGYEKREVVWDKKHELIWNDSATEDTTTWVGAIKTCEQLTHDGRSDWRLPNFNELYSITNHSGKAPAIHSRFINTKSKAYWTSTSGHNDSDRAWGINFKDGSDFTYDKTEQVYVRCVRDQ